MEIVHAKVLIINVLHTSTVEIGVIPALAATNEN